VRTLVDESVLAEEEISIGSGQRGLAVILQKKDFHPGHGQYRSWKIRRISREFN